MWGTATASYQIEGGVEDGNREESIWDRFSATPGKVVNGDTGAVACDHFHKFREDVQLIKQLGTKYYRFSIAWPRIQQWNASMECSTNKAGIQFYNELIDELLENGITPVATLYHWDLPVAIEDKYGGWRGDGVIADLFSAYAKVCFQEFGDRVKWWITLNEPWCSSVLSYECGEHAPGIAENPGVDVYLASHNLLRAHAKAVKVYRDEFQEFQEGKIGITLNTTWIEPKDVNDSACVEGAKRGMEFELGWYADPLYFGDYPESMRLTVGERLPQFTDEEKIELKGSSDFFGLNHYSSRYCEGLCEEEPDEGNVSYWKDIGTIGYEDKDWKRTDMNWAIVPWGLQKLLEYIQKKYHPRGGIIITENGLATKEENLEDVEKDSMRISFYRDYICAVHDAITGEFKADVRGYFLWSLMDNFEWAFGYGKRFGLYFVNFSTLERTAKPAVKWYSSVVKSNSLTK